MASSSQLAVLWEEVGSIRAAAKDMELEACLNMILCMPVLQVKVLTEEVTRDSIKDNAAVLELAGQQLGLRVDIRTCEVHVKALYALMKIPCPRLLARRVCLARHVFRGAVMEAQAWQLRRCLSFINNRLANRPNRPRDRILRNLMKALGVEWPEPEPEEEEEELDDNDEDGYEEEGEEESQCEEDPPVQDEEVPEMKNEATPAVLCDALPG